MSYQYTVTERRRRTTNTSGHGSRSTFGYWVPLVLTVTAATIGLAAWVWSERRDDEEDSSEDEHYAGGVPPPGYASMSGAITPGPAPPGGFQGPQFPGPDLQDPAAPMMPGQQQPGGFVPFAPGGFQGPPPAGFPSGGAQYDNARSSAVEQPGEAGLVARMSSAFGFGRSTTPSQSQPQSQAQTYDWANKPFSAGVAAAGAMFGAAITSLSGGGTEAYEDHERWSEEAEQRDNEREIQQGIRRRGTAEEFFSGHVDIPKYTSIARQKRRNVAVVVSAVGPAADAESEVGHHASILTHLWEHIDTDRTRVFVLIYAPDLKTHPLCPVAASRPSQSMTSSFSNISQTDAQTPSHTPGEFLSGTGEVLLASVDPIPIDEPASLYQTLYSQATEIVDHETLILPFTTPHGHKHILRSLAPEIVYIQESLCGRDGEIVSDLSGWVRQTVVVIGDEGGHGGLIDTDDESAVQKPETWWQKEERTGLGKQVTVVESLKIGEDWRRRVDERD
ncbi:hypothetical protein A1O3_03187 [Capronia epimyces CBS 606.96]|uniref:Uncharacterized protein n=1 Tax=Capronia epimyces CBS 606.96 TaxID=1182542 RepID=W9YC64_9EURO|nr:uncharacterized protein A1O3_03187 [Capronia epimyces CBS 606.96]EXJ90118.1 hypothetical protein A1O3_03187 [Capronia epimyces CBS 606.96]